MHNLMCTISKKCKDGPVQNLYIDKKLCCAQIRKGRKTENIVSSICSLTTLPILVVQLTVVLSG